MNLWRSIPGGVAIVAWITVLAWLVADAERLVRVEVCWGWLALGLLGILVV